MKRTKCVTCGSLIFKSASLDPNLCRECEHENGTELERYRYLDVS